MTSTPRPHPPAETAAAQADAPTIVLVEGISDQLAVEALARRRGRRLVEEGVSVVSMGGVTNVGQFLRRFGPQGSGRRLAGLCDAGEVDIVRLGLKRAGLGDPAGVAELESLGFSVCIADLEDELIRAVGTAAVVRLIEEQGEQGSFSTFQKQAAQQGRSRQEQLRRFMGTRGGRKIRYAPLLVAALDLDNVPRPLDDLLAYL